MLSSWGSNNKYISRRYCSTKENACSKPVVIHCGTRTIPDPNSKVTAPTDAINGCKKWRCRAYILHPSSFRMQTWLSTGGHAFISFASTVQSQYREVLWKSIINIALKSNAMLAFIGFLRASNICSLLPKRKVPKPVPRGQLTLYTTVLFFSVVLLFVHWVGIYMHELNKYVIDFGLLYFYVCKVIPVSLDTNEG